MALGRTLLVSGLAATSAFLWACDGQSIATGRVTTATPSKAKGGYAVSINSIAAKKIGEDRYNYNKSVSIKFETTGSLQVSSAESDKPSGLLAIVYAESSGILEQGTAPEIMYVPVHNGEARLRIVEYESYMEGGSIPSGVPKYEFRKFGFVSLKQFDVPPVTQQPNAGGNLVSFKASVQSVFKAQASDYFRGRTELEIVGEGALKGAAFTVYVSRTTQKAADADDIGAVTVVQIPVLDGRATLTQLAVVGDFGAKEPPPPDEYQWTVLGYSTDLEPVKVIDQTP